MEEHDPEDLAKGWLRLGREFKSKPVDITDGLYDLELVPMWKQIGRRPNTESEPILWLWDNGHSTKNGLDVWPKAKDHWYICLDGKCLGNIYLNENKVWVANCSYFAAFHFHYESADKNECLRACLQIHSEGHEYR